MANTTRQPKPDKRHYRFRPQTPPIRPQSSIRCEQCQQVLLIHERTYCWLCAGLVAVYGKEVA